MGAKHGTARLREVWAKDFKEVPELLMMDMQRKVKGQVKWKGNNCWQGFEILSFEPCRLSAGGGGGGLLYKVTGMLVGKFKLKP